MEDSSLIGKEGKAKESLEQENEFIQSDITLRLPFLTHGQMEKHRNPVLKETLLEQLFIDV